MRQTSSKLLTLTLFLAFLCLHAHALDFFGGSGSSSVRKPIMNPYGTTSGIVNLKKDASSNDGSFYVEANLDPSYGILSNSSHSTGSANSSVRMMVSIANTETMLSGNCLSFNYFDCSRYNCEKYSWSNTINFPTFSANVNYAKSKVYLDYTYWSLGSAYLYIAQSCQGRLGLSIGSNRHGVIGLGADASTKSDFTYEAIFSILIDSDLNGGKLLFMKDSKYYQSSKAMNTLTANSTWQVQASRGSVQFASSSVSFNGYNIMFDINSDAIGLPSSLYNSFMTSLGSISDFTCTIGYNYRPLCITTKQLKDLPDIILSVNDDQIKIPSQIYASLVSDSGSTRNFYLNFKSTSPYLIGKNFVTPSFANSIILDANFMSYHYVVFDATTGNNYISLYPSINASYQPYQPNLIKFIVSGAVGALLLISLCLYCCCKKKKIIDNNAPVDASLNNTTFNQAPLVYNQQEINNNPVYSHDAPNYNYAGYIYPAQPQGVNQLYPQFQGGMNYPAQPQIYPQLPAQPQIHYQGYPQLPAQPQIYQRYPQLPPPPVGNYQQRAKQ